MGHSFWPLALLICSNLVYQTCSKCASKDVNPFAALTVVYLIAAIGSFLAFMAFLVWGNDAGTVMENVKSMNWANYVLGLSIIGLEGGFLYLYRSGWSVSVGPICSYTGVAIGLLVLGALCFGEHISLRQIAGTLLCLGGIALVTFK